MLPNSCVPRALMVDNCLLFRPDQTPCTNASCLDIVAKKKKVGRGILDLKTGTFSVTCVKVVPGFEMEGNLFLFAHENNVSIV